MNEQLTLFGESEAQQHFASETWGLLTFYPAKGAGWMDTCRHCLLWDSVLGETPECANAHCEAAERSDGQNGYYSIHEMPNN